MLLISQSRLSGGAARSTIVSSLNVCPCHLKCVSAQAIMSDSCHLLIPNFSTTFCPLQSMFGFDGKLSK